MLDSLWQLIGKKNLRLELRILEFSLSIFKNLDATISSHRRYRGHLTGLVVMAYIYRYRA